MQSTLAISRVVSGVTSAGGLRIGTEVVIDVLDHAVLVFSGVASHLGGTLTSVSAYLETSEDLETWEVHPSGMGLQVGSLSLIVLRAKYEPYGRYVRAHVIITGTNATVTYSLWLDAFRSG